MTHWYNKLQPTEKDLLNYHIDIMTKVYDRIDNVHKRPLHEGQIKMARAFFNDHKKVIMSQWGRSGGKTETVLFIAGVYALLNPNSLIYIICPELKQGRKIYWTPGRLQEYLPPEFIRDVSESLLMVVLNNGSKIIIDGSENHESLRGIKPNLVFYDEFQGHKKEFDLTVMRPNLFAKGASLIVTGTPPGERDAYYVEFRDQILSDIKNGDKTRAYFEFPTTVNPSQDIVELKKLMNQLIKSGDTALVEREYMGRLVFGGVDAIFPNWAPSRIMKSPTVLNGLLQKQQKKLQFYTVMDPGTAACFAVLFAAYNPSTAQLYLLDEIYEKNRKQMDSRTIFNNILKKEAAIAKQLGVGALPFRRVYDEAGAWFQNEVQANFGQNMSPTAKWKADDERQLSTIRVLMSEDNCLFISERCKCLIWEIEAYCYDKNGRLPKKHDHLIDCLRYLIEDCGYKFITDVVREEHQSYSLQVGERTVKAYVSDDWGDDTFNESMNDGYESWLN